jgi:hypothetical protein
VSGRREHELRVRTKAGRQVFEESHLGRFREAPIVIKRLRRQLCAVCFTPRRKQMPASAHQRVEFALRRKPLRSVADRIKQHFSDVRQD